MKKFYFGLVFVGLAIMAGAGGMVSLAHADATSTAVSTATSTTVAAPCTLSVSDFVTALQNGSVRLGVTGGINLSKPGVARFQIENGTQCSIPVSLSSYKMFINQPATGWLSTQQIVDATSSLVAPNTTQDFSVALPSCKAQVDAWYGNAPLSFGSDAVTPSNVLTVPYVIASTFTSGTLCSMATSTPTSTIPSADVSIVKTVDNSTPSVGDTINYTLTVSDLGPATATGVVARDVLPAGITFVSATATDGSYATSTGTWTIGDMNASSEASLDIAATVNAGTASTTITNTATVAESASTTDSNLANNSSSVSITVQNPASSANNGSITICKVIENASGTIMDGSAFPGNTFMVPGITSVPSSTPLAIGTLPTTTFTTPLAFNAKLFGSSTNNAQCVTYSNLAIGHYYYGQESIATTSSEWATPQYNDDDSIAPSSTSDFYSYSGQLFDNDPTNDASRNLNSDGDIQLLTTRPDRTLVVLNQFLGTAATTTPTSTPPCTLSASQFETDVHNGSISFGSVSLSTSTASFTLTNHTSCTAPISLSSYKMFVAPNGPQWLSTQQLFNLASSSVAASSTQTLTVTLPSCKAQVDAWYGTAPTNLLDTDPYSYPDVPFVLAWAFSSSPLCVGAPTSTPIADLSITKTVDNSTPVVGDTVNYTLTVSALGPATSTGVVATDTLPSGLTFENATATVGSYATSTGTWTIGDMSASSSAQLMIAALVDSSDTVGQVITNTAVVGESASSTNNNPSNSSSSVSITVQPTGCTSNCGGGGGTTTPATSTLMVNVSGLNASDTAAISVADLGPTATTTQTATTGNGSSTFVLPTNDQYALTATTTAPNYSVATSSGCSGTLSANMTCSVVFTLASSTTTTTPSNTADITIAKTVDNANPAGGDTINYTLTVTALGPVTSTFVTVQDVFPLGLSLASMTPSQGSTTDGGTINWNVGTLSPNATTTLQIAAVVSPSYDGQTITNTATVSELSSLIQTGLSVTSSSVSINVQPAPCTSNCGGGGTTGGGGGISTAQIGITKTVDNASPNPGDTIHYTLTMQSKGPSDAIGVVATDTLPAGVTFVSASSSAGTYNSTTGTWTLGMVAPGVNPTLVITATVNSSDPIGEVITNTAAIGESTSVNNPITTNDTASATITVGGSNGGGGTTGGGGGGSVGVPSGGGGVIVGGGGGTTGGGGNGGGQVLGASATCGIYLDQYIHPIDKALNSPVEVDKLQTFLNMNLGTTLPITGYYGPETIAAVDQFQVKYHIEVLRPWLPYGLPTEYTPTDYVYKTTQRWINLIMCSSLNLPIPQLP
jgi:large repetitive protein